MKELDIEDMQKWDVLVQIYIKNSVSCFCFVSFVLLACSKVGFLFLTQQKLEVFFFWKLEVSEQHTFCIILKI